jgi:restriction system protein
LAQEGLIDLSHRGVWSLTEASKDRSVSQEEARKIYAKWNRTFQDRRRTRSPSRVVPDDGTETDSITDGIAPDADDVLSDYKASLLTTLLGLPPTDFERFAQRLLRESGFSNVEVTGQTGDGGIDGSGSLKLNPLISRRVLFQCKRYKGSVSAAQGRDFRGAMQGRADMGILITTGSITADARREASRDGVPLIELIDGSRLVEILQSLSLGLQPRQTFVVDERFFDEFRK